MKVSEDRHSVTCPECEVENEVGLFTIKKHPAAKPYKTVCPECLVSEGRAAKGQLTISAVTWVNLAP